MKELGAHLKRIRVSNGVNISEAAEDLDLSVAELENIESGNVKAFKDLYDLKNYVKSYAKYLGLDSDKVIDKFDGFIFEHTSKISLDDIKNAQKKEDSELNVKKIKSPYTKEYKKKSYVLPVFFVGVIVVLTIFLIIYIVVSTTNNVPTRVDELLPLCREEFNYEFTY